VREVCVRRECLIMTDLPSQHLDAADGTNDSCGQYYHVETGDYCNLICIKYGINLVDFVFLNPTINEK
jgi:hypothetical protein